MLLNLQFPNGAHGHGKPTHQHPAQHPHQRPPRRLAAKRRGRGHDATHDRDTHEQQHRVAAHTVQHDPPPLTCVALAQGRHKLQHEQKTQGNDGVNVQHHADLVAPAVAKVEAFTGRGVCAWPFGEMVGSAKGVEIVQLGGVDDALAGDADEAKDEEQNQVVGLLEAEEGAEAVPWRGP